MRPTYFTEIHIVEFIHNKPNTDYCCLKNSFTLSCKKQLKSFYKILKKFSLRVIYNAHSVKSVHI